MELSLIFRPKDDRESNERGEYLLQMRSEIDAELARQGVSENTPLESGDDFHDKYDDRIVQSDPSRQI